MKELMFPIVLDPSVLRIYLDPVSFDADPYSGFSANETRVRLEGPAICVVRQPARHLPRGGWLMSALGEEMTIEEERLDAELYQEMLTSLAEERGSAEELKWWPVDLGS